MKRSSAVNFKSTLNKSTLKPFIGVERMMFDFDGTIANTLDSAIAIINELAPEFGYRRASSADVEKYRNLSSRELVRVAEIPLWQIPFLLRRVKKELNYKISTLSPIPGIIEVLQELKTQGVSLGILTSNSQENVYQFLRNNQMETLFDSIYSGTHLFGKDKVLKKILARETLKPQQLMYVGDETRDVDAAKKVGVKATAVSWGFNSATALVARDPDFTIDYPDQLIEVLGMQVAS
ncbi:MAG: HAD-IA family hydrolase [Cyanobacteriota bacterium]|nr:HAD-IA family hydrolase [Cyanobacteriota bacterium]